MLIQPPHDSEILRARFIESCRTGYFGTPHALLIRISRHGGKLSAHREKPCKAAKAQHRAKSRSARSTVCLSLQLARRKWENPQKSRRRAALTPFTENISSRTYFVAVAACVAGQT